MADVKSCEELAERGIGELGALVRDEMSGRAKPTRRRFKELLDLLGRGLLSKDAGGKRHTGEGVEHDGNLEMKEAEETGYIGQVG